LPLIKDAKVDYAAKSFGKLTIDRILCNWFYSVVASESEAIF